MAPAPYQLAVNAAHLSGIFFYDSAEASSASKQ